MPVSGINAPETFFSREYSQNMGLLLQQKQSKLRPTVTVQSLRGYEASMIDQIGKRSPSKVTTRHADTIRADSTTDRRWVTPSKYTDAELFDTFDLIRQNVDPRGTTMMEFAAGFNRTIDDVIIEGILGNNKTGQEGGTNATFDTANIVAAGGTGLTVDKLRAVRQKMAEAEVDFDAEPVTALISPAGMDDLLSETEVTSSDFNAVRTLVNGRLDTFMGFQFVETNRILGANNYAGTQSIAAATSRALFYPASGVGLGLWEEPMTRVSELPEKNYSWQVYMEMAIGATRLEEGRVFAADYDTA